MQQLLDFPTSSNVIPLPTTSACSMPTRAGAKAKGKANAAATTEARAAKRRRKAQVAASNVRRDGRRAALRAFNRYPTWCDPRAHRHRQREEHMKIRNVSLWRAGRIGRPAWVLHLRVFLPFFLSRTEGSSARRNVRDRAACTCSCRAVRSTTSPTAPSYDLTQALPCSISSTC